MKIELTDSYDHDYCNDNLELVLKQEEIKEENVKKISGLPSLLDHSYSLPSDKEGLKPIKKSKSPVKQVDMDLIHGLEHYIDPIKSRARNVRPKNIKKSITNSDKVDSFNRNLQLSLKVSVSEYKILVQSNENCDRSVDPLPTRKLQSSASYKR